MEQWRGVVGHPDYEVSDEGRVRRLTTRGGRMLPEPKVQKPGRHNHGYATACLGGSGVTRSNRKRLLHALVLEAFVGPCPPGMEARHWNGVQTDNRLSNLLWGTPGENSADRARHGTNEGWSIPHKPGTHLPNAKHGDKALAAFQAEGRQRDIAAALGVSQQFVSAVKRGAIWGHITGLPATGNTGR